MFYSVTGTKLKTVSDGTFKYLLKCCAGCIFSASLRPMLTKYTLKLLAMTSGSLTN